MPLSIFFWVIFIIWVLFGGWAYWGPPPQWRPFGTHLLLGLLIFLLGWAAFGFIVGGK